MRRHVGFLAGLSLLLFGCGSPPEVTKDLPVSGNRTLGFTVIAHRGASGYLPEHTLAGTTMAHGMGADYIEQDVLLSRDGELIVLHDLYLDAVTDVSRRYPGRQREDGHYYAIDFDLAEIRTLRVNERRKKNGKPAFPGRFPVGDAIFRVPTLREALLLIQGLNTSTGRDVGIYVEPKSPAWHREEGKDLVSAVLRALGEFGYNSREDRAFLQSFDLDALKYARFELNCDLKLVQLIGENSWHESPSDFDYLRSEAGLTEIASFADGIGPWLPQVLELSGRDSGQSTGLIEGAHRHGLLVHAYTLRADQLPDAIGSIDDAMYILRERLGLDGVFTDHPDQVISYLQAGN
jgi:glycerophosphoryl diester phosphodiesterase